MTTEPSHIQRQILDTIVAFRAEYDRPPTNREIGSTIGTKSTGRVAYHLMALERKGFLTRTPRTARGLRLLPAALAVGAATM